MTNRADRDWPMAISGSCRVAPCLHGLYAAKGEEGAAAKGEEGDYKNTFTCAPSPNCPRKVAWQLK